MIFLVRGPAWARAMLTAACAARGLQVENDGELVRVAWTPRQDQVIALTLAVVVIELDVGPDGRPRLGVPGAPATVLQELFGGPPATLQGGVARWTIQPGEHGPAKIGPVELTIRA